MATWWVRDRRAGNAIVNAIESRTRPTDALHSMEGAEHLWLDTDPPRSVLEAYPYWNERP